MTDDTTNRGAPDLWMRLWAPWASSFAPQDLTQPINPGWSFGNVIVNQRNSRSPETEQAILAEESYGRQIGKLLEAVHALIEEKPGGTANPAYRDIEALRHKVERLKREAADTPEGVGQGCLRGEDRGLALPAAGVACRRDLRGLAPARACNRADAHGAPSRGGQRSRWPAQRSPAGRRPRCLPHRHGVSGARPEAPRIQVQAKSSVT